MAKEYSGNITIHTASELAKKQPVKSTTTKK